MNHWISSPEVLYCHQMLENLLEHQPHALYLLFMGLNLLTEFPSIVLTFPDTFLRFLTSTLVLFFFFNFMEVLIVKV